jgi:hypothetical protein
MFAMAGLFVGLSPLRAAPPLTGAIFTTDSTCTGVDLNIYDSKDDVYIDGGPDHPGGAGLPDGNYCVQVTDPSGQTVLGLSDPGAVTVVGGEFVECYQLSAILKTASSGFTVPGYDDTPNEGGEYKVWVSTDCTFANNSSKTDNFQVKEECPKGTVTVTAFYDANTNGLQDEGEPNLGGWEFHVFAHNNLHLTKHTARTAYVRIGAYTVTEAPTVEPNWIHTNANKVQFMLAPETDQPVSFGNVSLGNGGSNSVVFWSNKSGQRVITADDLSFLSGLSLRDSKGLDFNPSTAKALSDWSLNATASNMAYLLSTQLAAMELNVRHASVNGAALVHAPALAAYGTYGLNSLGFIRVNDLMAAAATEIQTHPVTKNGSLDRPYQEAMKNVLDDANNNKIFVLAAPAPFSFDEE